MHSIDVGVDDSVESLSRSNFPRLAPNLFLSVVVHVYPGSHLIQGSSLLCPALVSDGARYVMRVQHEARDTSYRSPHYLNLRQLFRTSL